MSEAQAEYVTLEASPDLYLLPPFDGKEHMAFGLRDRTIIVRLFNAGRPVAFIAEKFGCAEVDIQAVLRAAGLRP